MKNSTPWRDVTFSLNGAFPVWPGDAPFAVEAMQRMHMGDAADVSALHMSAHFATHMDAPAHYLPGGAAIDQAPLPLLLGDAYLLDARSAGQYIGAQDVERVPAGTQRVLIRSAYEQHDKSTGFCAQFAGLTAAATAALKKARRIFVGGQMHLLLPF